MYEFLKCLLNYILGVAYIKPIDPAVNPTTKKNVNSNKSLGKELTIKLI